MDCTNPRGCTLDREDVADRVKAWRDVAARALSRRAEPTRITTVYPSDPRLLQRLRALVAAEAGCCAFLSFTVDEGPVETVVELEFPEEARALVDLVVPAADA